MANGLNILPSAELDFVSLGALIHRLDPGIIPFRKATECLIHVSGGEFNCAANLADCFGLKTGIATAMVKYPIGDLIHERVRAMGVRPFYKYFEHNGVTGPNMATVYSDRGMGVRGPVVFYNRSNEAAAQLKPGDFNWKEIFSGGVRWFHSGGIFAALSPTTPDVIIEGMQAAKAHGAVVSFDLNFRAKLWKVFGGESKAVEVLNRIVANVDVLVGNEEDLQKGLGIKGPDVVATSGAATNPDTFFEMIGRVVEKFPNVKAVVDGRIVNEFTGALPRAKLYTNWQVVTNDQAALARLVDPAFDPSTTVLLATPPPASPPTATTPKRHSIPA